MNDIPDMNDPMLQQMMAELEKMMSEGGGDAAFENILGDVMDSFMTKELLHEPLKEIADRVSVM